MFLFPLPPEDHIPEASRFIVITMIKPSILNVWKQNVVERLKKKKQSCRLICFTQDKITEITRVLLVINGYTAKCVSE